MNTKRKRARSGSKAFLSKVKRRKTITVKGKLLVHSSTHKGYIDPEDHSSGGGFGGPTTVWRFRERTHEVIRHKHKRYG